MKGLGRVIGWILILVGIAAVMVIAYLIASGSIPGNFLAGLLMAAPAILVAIIGGALVRASNRRGTTTFNEADPQWTRRSIR